VAGGRGGVERCGERCSHRSLLPRSAGGAGILGATRR
jgi:hypothetical protein